MFEIDFLWVGEKTNTGDAITVRFERPDGQGTAVMVVDGGFVETGNRIAEHVRTFYGTSTVDLMVCTHPDDDHIKGLFSVIEELDVKRLLIHQPSAYGFEASDDTKGELVDELIAAAIERGTAVDHVYAGAQYFGGAVTLLGPTEPFYVQQLQAQASGTSLASQFASIFASAAKTFVRLFRDSDPGETMNGDNGGTSPRNNSSIILSIVAGGYRALLTGDAGAPALNAAADQLDAAGVHSSSLSFFDVPHHGSRHNLTPELLDRLLGPANGGEKRGTAFVSVGKEADDFPRPEVANALKRRGFPVCETRGQNIWWHRDTPDRSSYVSIEPLGWLPEEQ